MLWARVRAGAEITVETVKAAEEVAGVRFSDDERALLVESLKAQGQQVRELHAVELPNAVAPAVRFDPVPPGYVLPPAEGRRRSSRLTPRGVPADLEELAFAPVRELGELLRRRRVTSLALTEMCLARLERLDAQLKCVVTLVRDRAVAQARAMDAELAAGRWRGPLHGVPWGAKDLLATRGYPTTWGAEPYRTQRLDEDAEVVRRLDRAGAVLVAKLTLGELAMGDTWFGGRTNNPWNLAQGSSGSSAGSAAAVAAGGVPFAIGSETLGSISSPSTRCGVTGLRPTFGRVPRTGAMALSWTMDKLGPIARTVEDCALVLEAIHGPDGRDATCVAAPFTWDAELPLAAIRVGYVPAIFDLPETVERDGRTVPVHPTKSLDDAALAQLRRLGIDPVPVALPDLAYGAMRLMLAVEGAAAFDGLVRGGGIARLAQQGPAAWPNVFRTARFVSGVDYVNASRVRTLALEAWARVFADVDVIAVPTTAQGNVQLVATNMTGHPAVIVPSGFRPTSDSDPTPVPVSFTFLGRLFGEQRLLRVADAWQRLADHHLRRPPVG